MTRRHPPSAQAKIARDARAEQRRTREAPRAQRLTPNAWPLREVAFSFYGDLEVSVSPRWSHPDGARLHQVLVQLDAAGTSTTTVRLRRNAIDDLVVVSLPAGSHREEWDDDDGIDLSTFDVLQAVITSPGTNARSLTVQARFQ